MNERPRLPPRQHLVAPKSWPSVGERVPASGPDLWTLTIAGQVARPRSFSLAELQTLPATHLTTDLHCVTRWSRFNTRFTGVTLAELLARIEPTPAARFVSFEARSERRHSSSLPLDEALALGVLLVWEADGAPLESSHGGPLRSYAPGKYLYKSVKWVERIELLEQDRLGYWEAEAGYHNGADPWLEQRYLAPSLTKVEAERLLTSRDFARRDLRSIMAAGRDLSGLRAVGALLRDADFTRAGLAEADFSFANLTNARFCDADLQGARFTGADLEGTDFAGADLRGVDFLGASLFGATFAETSVGGRRPRYDATTRFRRADLDALSGEQRAWLERSGPTIEG